MNLLALYYFFALSTVLVPVILWIIRCRYGLFKFQTIYYYFIFSAIVEIVVATMAFFSISNIQIINYYFIAEFLLLFSTLVLWLNYSEKQNKILLSIGIVFSILAAVYQFNYAVPGQISIFYATVFSLVLILLSVKLILKISKNDFYPFSSEYFWYAWSILLHFSLGVVVLVTSEIVLDNNLPLRAQSWLIYAFISFLSNLVYIKGLQCIKHQIRNSYLP